MTTLAQSDFPHTFHLHDLRSLPSFVSEPQLFTKLLSGLSATPEVGISEVGIKNNWTKFEATSVAFFKIRQS